MFKIIYYEDTDHQLFDTREYEGKIVKVIVRKKSDSVQFEKFIDKLYSQTLPIQNCWELRPQWWCGRDRRIGVRRHSSILDRYIEEADISLDKSKVKNFMRATYQEACELIFWCLY